MKRFQFLSILTLLTIIVTACTGGLSEEDAENALKAAFEGEAEAANAYFCPDNQVDELASLTQEVVFVEVDCQKEGVSRMECKTSFTQAEEPVEINFVFRIKDDLLCEPTLN